MPFSNLSGNLMNKLIQITVECDKIMHLRNWIILSVSLLKLIKLTMFENIVCNGHVSIVDLSPL